MRARHFLPLLLLTGLISDGQPQSTEPYRISANVNLVVLHPIVRDRKGQFVSNLRQQDFEIYEDGFRQSIRLFEHEHEDVLVSVGLVIDHSGSMRQKLPEVIAAARTSINSSSPSDEMFVVNFNDTVTLGLPGAIRFSDRPDQLARAISNTPPAGETALYDAVIAALEVVQAGEPEQKVLVVISDGGDTASAQFA